MATEKGSFTDLIVGGFIATLVGGTILVKGFGETNVLLAVGAVACLAFGGYMFLRGQQQKTLDRFREKSDRMYSDMKPRRPHSRDSAISTIRRQMAENDDDD